MNQKELDEIKLELQTFLNKKLKKRDYLAVVSILDEYNKDASTGQISMLTHYLRVGNVSVESSFVKIKSILSGFKVALDEIIGSERR